MKILIDLQSCQSPSHMRGIGRYSLDLALEMITIGSGKHDFHILLNSSLSETILSLRAQFEPLVGRRNIHIFGGVTGVSGIENNIELTQCAEIIREFHIKLIDPDFVHISSFFEGLDNNSVTNIPERGSIPTAVTLYDLIPLINESDYLESPLLKAWYYRKIEQFKRADLFFSISESAKKECLEYLNIDEKKVFNISSSVSNAFLNIDITETESNNILDNLNIIGKYVLYTANLDTRKNITGLFKAYSLVDKEIRDTLKLVIVSHIDEERRLIIEAEAAKAGLHQGELILTGHVSNKELIVLYKRCSLFVFPSLHEGFGLPCLEAMVCGAAVVGSNTTSIPEVIGLEDAMFNPLDPVEMAALIEKALVDNEYYELLLNNSKQRVKMFSWTTTAKKVLERMESFTVSEKLEVSKESKYKQCIDSISDKISKLSKSELKKIANCIDLSMPKERPELLIDITALAESDAKTGIQRVVKSIIEKWFDLSLSHQIRLVYLASDGHYYYAFDYESKYANNQNRDKGYVLPTSGDVFIGLDLVAHAASVTGEIYKKWREFGVFICIVVYDILPIRMPEFFHSGIKDAFPLWGSMIIERADKLLCISESVANDLEEFISSSAVERLLPYTIEHFHLGADFTTPKNVVTESVATELEGLDLSKTFLMVGTIEPRKGHEQVVNAFETLFASRKDYTLLIVGKEGWNTECLVKKLKSHNANTSNVRWLSNCSDDTLQYLYHNCCALIAASYGEGFGLPLIEAAQQNIPVIARDIPVFREVAGDYAYYFDNDNRVDVIATTIRNWLELYEKDEHPKSDNMPWLTWEESSEQLLRCLNIN
ncbi:glycosyltransferase family 4 protein [Psychromonas aquimarina]|uniref:glycosyltransferase family 4 protein n=1 Tax=Psychromonas aquimarina TaxID=444919 RepID=UPI0004253DEE|nr:glycosyltransferase family 1 protein [Psychromonas aquimarina]